MVAHLRRPDPQLGYLLRENQVVSHPFVVGELALGNEVQRRRMAGFVDVLIPLKTADDDEMRVFIDRHALWGQGIGYLDAHLLAAAALAPGVRIWSLDRYLMTAATRLPLAMTLN